MAIVVKLAESDSELAQIDALNHGVFGVELGQEPASAGVGDPRLHLTEYIVAKDGDQVLGMLGITPPGVRFSLEESVDSLPGIDRRYAVEIRRLGVTPGYRGKEVLIRMLRFLREHAMRNRYLIGYISAVSDRVSAYGRMGFESFGASFVKGAVEYQPMMVRMEGWRLPADRGRAPIAAAS